MTTWLVTRHPGAVEWVQRHGPGFDCHVQHLAPEAVQPGDRVIGNLPMHLAAQYWHLVLRVPEQARGQELSAQQLSSLGATLQRFHVQPHKIRPAA